MGWWVTNAYNNNGQVYLLSWVIWVIGSIVLHELAHGWAALWQGDGTPRWSGHMTWNPLVHMGTWSLIMFAIMGIAWGQMPVNPSNFRSRYGDAIVSAAGPAMNLGLALLCMIGLALWVVFGGSVQDPVRTNVTTFLKVGALLNIVLMLFNLLPVPPLDGYRILSDFVPSFGRLWMGEQGAVVGVVAMVLLFAFGGQLIFSTGEVVRFTLTEAMVGALKGLQGSGPTP